MPSMLEVMREYKHLAARKRAEGSLPASLEERLLELEGVVKAGREGAPKEPEPSEALPRGASIPPARSNPKLPAARPPTASSGSRPALPAPAPRSPPSAPAARASTQDLPRPKKPEKLTALQEIDLRLPQELPARLALLAGVGAFLLLLDVALVVWIGVPFDTILSSFIPSLLAIAGLGWCAVYPGAVFALERAQARSDRHINEPDFEARAPVIEPWIGMITVLGLVIWIWLGGHTTAGTAHVTGYLFGAVFGLFALALPSILAVRPLVARSVKRRALKQYLEGGVYHLNKGNPKRARRMLERALEEARGTPKQGEVARQLKTAALQEADELRNKGHHQHADELVRSVSQKQGMQLVVGWDTGASSDLSADLSALSGDVEVAADDDLLAQAPRAPRLVLPGEIMIERGPGGPPASADEAAIRERVRLFERRGRHREAFETLLAAQLPVGRALALEAAKEYIADSALRSADAIFEVLGERQIPEFYQAVAAEWTKESPLGDPPPDALQRLARLLEEQGQLEPAARIACRAALTKAPDQEAKRRAQTYALGLCKKLGMEPPVELVEAMGDKETAARVYEAEGRAAEALRCYTAAADEALERREPPARLIPLLSKLFLLEPNLPDRYLDLLAQHVLETQATGPGSIKILTAYRRRKKQDDKLGQRLFQLFVDAHQAEDAWLELEQSSKAPGVTPEALIKDCRLFVDRFTDHQRARALYVRTLLKVGRVDDAAAQVRMFLLRLPADADPKEGIALLELLLDWGHDDKELRKALALLRLRSGGAEQALVDLERYARDGGRDPEALAQARALLSTELALSSGAPNHERLLRLGRFLASCGDPEGAIPHLEICRGAQKEKAEAEVLLARAYVAVGKPKRALALLREVIASRPLGETLELHYEMARAYEAMGHMSDAQKVDRAITEVDPDFIREYEKSRPRADRADTQWQPGASELVPPPKPKPELDEQPTDITEPKPMRIREPVRSEPAPSPTPPKRHDSMRPAPARQSSKSGPSARGLSPSQPGTSDAEARAGLQAALMPRYRLLRRLGAGGMGEVHLAEDQDLGRYVAIKVLRRSLATDLFLQKFREEARIVAQLHHPNIVSIFDLGSKESWSYIVMEFVDGPDLATLVNRSGSGFERRRLVKIIAGTAEAMAYAHSRGVIHRDLKPANILVGQNDNPKVTDFGIAKVLQPDDHETAFSAAGLQVGTVNYMAPEQLAGRPVDARTDIYLLATTVYVCLSGAFPFQGEAVAAQKLREEPTPLRAHVPTVSADLDALLLRCLARRPEDRYGSMTELAEALRRLPEARGR